MKFKVFLEQVWDTMPMFVQTVVMVIVLMFLLWKESGKDASKTSTKVNL